MGCGRVLERNFARSRILCWLGQWTVMMTSSWAEKVAKGSGEI